MLDKTKKLIFTHPPKCGGTSIEYALGGISSGYLEEHDKEIQKNGAALNLKSCSSDTLYKHESLAFHIQKIQQNNERLQDYFIFSCIRNPWDRAVSRFYHDKHIAVKRFHIENTSKIPEDYKFIEQSNFEEYLVYKYKTYIYFANKQSLTENAYNILSIKDFFYYENKYAVNYVIRFEKLKENFHYIFKKLNIKSVLPHIRFHNKKPNTNYQDYYTNLKLKTMVEEMGQETIKLFGYKFDI